MPDRLVDDARDRQRISRRRPSNRCQRERGGLLALKAGNIREIPATRCFTVFPNARRCRKQHAGPGTDQLCADVATKIGDNPQTSLPGSKVDSSEAEAVRSVINIRPTKDIGHNLHRLRVSLVGATVGIVYGRAGATHTPVRCRPLDQWLRALTYDAGTVSAFADLLPVSLLIPRFPHGGRERARRV
jgi:hypothetical protein